MKELSTNEFLIELRCLRTHLDPILNSRMKNVLNEAERRLSSDAPRHENFHPKAMQQGNRLTKEQILNKWLNKY